MKKLFVLDTNVLLHDPRAIFSFQDNDVVIPIVVIEELDKFKKGIDEMGRNARQISRILDEHRLKGKLSQGVQLDGGGNLRVELNHQSPQHLPPELVATKGDNRILATALNLSRGQKELPVILVTKDTNLRIKADALGLTAEDYETDTAWLASGAPPRPVCLPPVPSLIRGTTNGPSASVIGAARPSPYLPPLSPH